MSSSIPDTSGVSEAALAARAEASVALLRQDGWEIVYDYVDADSRRPLRVRVAYPDLEIRVVVDRWR
jgi:hypothetical protein